VPSRHSVLRQRIIAAAIDATVRSGWSSVTMGGLADSVGVSRQTVYNEVGSKPSLAEAMVAHELAGFLALVARAFDAHPDDAVAAVEDATCAVLSRAQRNSLLRAIVSASYGADTELLPLLTTNSTALLEAASTVVAAALRVRAPHLSEQRVAMATDVIVRTVLSHVMQPSGTPERTAEDISGATALLLR
jgi:AcrR family transcriptional regulator